MPNPAEDVIELVGRNEVNEDLECAILDEAVDVLVGGANVAKALGFPNEVVEDDQLG
jgi:hypothetical protein